MPTRIAALFRALGPAFVTAAVVLGPGSIVTNSKVGATYGYGMIWLLAAGIVLMIGMTALSARLGICYPSTLCETVAQRIGRPLAVLIGASVFGICACFQVGNNLGIYTALEPFVGGAEHPSRWLGISRPAAIVVALNLLMVAFLFGFRRLYVYLERGMKILVAVMLVAFAANYVRVLARPLPATEVEAAIEAETETEAEAETQAAPPAGVQSATAQSAAAGETRRWSQLLLPRLTTAADGRTTIVDHWGPLVALLGTTFSVAGAYFQSYLVRQKGWNVDDVRRGLVDVVAGIGALGLISLVIMLTSATVLRGATITSAADIAGQLEPLFGRAAVWLFCLGLFAAAFSSLLVNAAIGGSLLADGLGRGGYLEQPAARWCTLAALTVGLTALVLRDARGFDTVGLILVAQATTVLAWPLLAGVMMWLAVRGQWDARLRPPTWMWALGWTGLAVALVLAPRTAYILALQLWSR